MLQEHLGLEKYVTAQMYYSLVGRSLEYEFQSFAEYYNIESWSGARLPAGSFQASTAH